MTTEDEKMPSSSSIFGEFIRSEIEQAIETYRSQFAQYVQVLTVLLLADITLIGYALSTQSSGVLLIGVVIPITILYHLYNFSKFMLPALYTAISLEQKYGGRGEDWLATTLFSTAISTEIFRKLEKISTEHSHYQRMSDLRRIKMPPIGGSGRGLSRAFLVLAALGHVIAPIVLTAFFNWRLF